MKFTTYDVDNDKKDSGNCASGANGGWWYNNCYVNTFYYYCYFIFRHHI